MTWKLSPENWKNQLQGSQRQQNSLCYWSFKSQEKPCSQPATILPGQKTPVRPAAPVTWAKKEKSPEEHEKDRVGKYTPYFKDNTILPIPELVVEAEPKTLSFIVTDLRTRRLAGLKKETFGELFRTAGIPGQYYSQQSFATWDVLLPSEELAVKLAGSNVSTTGIPKKMQNKSHCVQHPNST